MTDVVGLASIDRFPCRKLICWITLSCYQTDRLKRILSSGGDELRKGSNVTDELMDKLVGEVNSTLLGYYDQVLAGETTH